MTNSDQVLEFTMLGAYLAVLLWIGIRSARRVKTSEDYTLAGRNVPWVIVLATTAATMIGGGASVGMVSKVADIGIAAAFVTCAWHIQLIFTGIYVAPKLRGLNLITVGDYFELKFGPLARELAVINCIIFLVGAIAAQMAAIGTVTNSILGIDYGWALVIGASVTVFYSTVGGIPAVVKTDVLQFVILVIGIGAAAMILFVDNGGFAAMAERAQAGQFSLTSHWKPMRVFSLFFAFLLGETFVPPYTVRCFIARDSNQARLGVAGAGIFLLLFLPLATLILGTSAQISPDVQQAMAQEEARIKVAAVAEGQQLSEEDVKQQTVQLAFPTLVRTTFHPIIAGIVIAAIIAAVMSSADSCLSCLSTVFMEDIYRRHLKRDAEDNRLLRVAQWTSLISGVAATVCAWFVRNIAELLEFVYDFWAPTMVLPFVVAIFCYRTNRVIAVVISMIVGIVAVVIWRFVMGPNYPYDIGPALFGTAVALIAFLAAWPLTVNRTPSGLFGPIEREPSA